MLVLLFLTWIEQTVKLAARANGFEHSPAQQTLTRPNSTSDCNLLRLRKKKGTSFHVIIPISIANLLAFSKLRKISSGGSVMLLSMLWDPLSAPPDSAILLRLFCKLQRNVNDASKLKELRISQYKSQSYAVLNIINSNIY